MIGAPMLLPLRRIASLFTLLLVLVVGCGDNLSPSPHSSAKELTAFSFTAATNAGLSMDVTGTINGTQIAATVPSGTSVTALVATFTTTGVAVTAGGAQQESGVTAHDFTNPVIYTVTAQDGTTRDFTVTVTIAGGAAKELTAFRFDAANNDQLTSDVVATINGTQIAATVPFGTDVTALVATFTTTGTAVTVGGTAQVSGTTANDFTSAVTYTVAAADSSTQDYTVTVTIAANSAKALTAFSFLSADNGVLPADVTATITGTDIAATVPYGTDVTGLVATFTTTGASVTVGGVAQTSGDTANDFTSPVAYRVTAADSSTQDYTVTVTVAPSPARELTAFSFESVNNSGTLTDDVIATIDEGAKTITATVPFGTDVTALIATFATTGMTVSVGAVEQMSGITANDFTSPVTYTVTAANSLTQNYTVTITIAPSTAKAFTTFAFEAVKNSGVLATDVFATIDEDNHTITATVPFGTDVTSLVATFTISGASVAIDTADQASGITANDFSSALTYTVTAADDSTQNYVVTVDIEPGSPDKDLTSFSFEASNNAGLPDDFIGVITGTDVAVLVPTGTDVTALVATFTATGDSVDIDDVVQVSGETANDFSAAVTYTVTAQDGSEQIYTVTVTTADYCGAPPTVANGSVVIDSGDGFALTTATYSCDPGFTLSAAAETTCTDGTWEPAPTCSTLLLSEVAVTPTEGEFIEILNPGTTAVDLSNFYLSDNGSYFTLPAMVATDTLAITSTDFIVRFPAGASIPAQGVVTVALASATDFTGEYGAAPTYSVADGTMVSVITNGTTGLTNTGEPVVLFYWDGASDLVRDVDVMIVGAPSSTNLLTDKSGMSQDGPDADTESTAYATDAHTIAAQPSSPGLGFSTKRIALEVSELQTGGNGLSGADETSEATSMSWDIAPYTAPTPGVVPDALLE